MNTVDCTPLLPALPSDITVNRKGISHQSLLIQYINVQIYKYSGIEAVVERVFVVTFDNKAVLNGLLAVNEIVLGDDADGEAIDLTDALVLTVCRFSTNQPILDENFVISNKNSRFAVTYLPCFP